MSTKEPAGCGGDQDSPEGAMDSSRMPPRQELKQALWVFAAVTLACAGLFQLSRVLGIVRKFLSDLIAAIFLIVPTVLISRRKEDFEDYGLVARPLGRGLLFFFAMAALVFPLFAVGSFLFYRQVCAWHRAGVMLPRAYQLMCPHFAVVASRVRLRTGPRFLWRSIAQLGVIALPEEYFFRGYLQTRLERVWPPQRHFLGGGLGVYLLVTSLLFALGHVLVDFNPLRLAVFFPSLVFGWMRSATGSILASVLFHACSNIVSELVHRSLGFS